MASSDQKPKETAEEFLSRWSRRKRQVREQSPASPPAGVPAPDAETPLPDLPPVEQLGMDSDYRGFFHPKVDEALRRAALKKLFRDPHFNVMDGLDTYIDDYSISDPLPAAMLGELKQAQNILAWARETEEEAAVRRSLPAAEGEQVAGTGPDSADTIPAAQSTAQEPAVRASGNPTPDDGAQSA